MENRKLRILSIFLILFLSISCFCMGFFSCDNVYAADQSDIQSLEGDELVDAFKAYCKARDLTIDGSIADAVTSVTTLTFNTICNTLGINVSLLQANLWKKLDGMGRVSKFLYNYTGVNLMNQIFAQLLQDNNLAVGDEDVNKIVKQGKWYVDYDGNGYWVTIVKRKNNLTNGPWSDILVQQGDVYHLDGKGVYQLYASGQRSVSFNFQSLNDYTFGIFNNATAYYSYYGLSYNGNKDFYSFSTSDHSKVTNFYSLYVLYDQTANQFGLGYLGSTYNNYPNGAGNAMFNIYSTKNNTTQDTDVVYRSPKIKAPIEPPEDDDVIEIEPDGTITEPAPEPGGSVPDWTLPDSQITPIDPENPSGGSNIDWNFQLPNLDIDWSINGLSEKFPFCIPFDVVSFCQVLSAEPVAPRITGEVPIGTITTWSFDYDLSEYNAWASILRTVELFGFVIGLIFITVKLVKG